MRECRKVFDPFLWSSCSPPLLNDSLRVGRATGSARKRLPVAAEALFAVGPSSRYPGTPRCRDTGPEALWHSGKLALSTAGLPAHHVAVEKAERLCCEAQRWDACAQRVRYD